MKSDAAAFAAGTVAIAGLLVDRVEDEGPMRWDFYTGANCLVCGSTLYTLACSCLVPV